MRVLQILVLLFLVNSFANAQACGYTFLTIYLTDSNGNVIKDALIETFDKDFKAQDYLHNSRKNWIAWSENKQAYFGSEGMCGGHRNVGLRITAKDFEKFDFLTNLPLGWTIYSIKLKRTESDENVEVIKLNKLNGKISDETNTGIPVAKVSFINDKEVVFQNISDSDGNFEVFLPDGNYTIEIVAIGFIKTKITNYKVSENSNLHLDATLYVTKENIGCLTSEPSKKEKKKLKKNKN